VEAADELRERAAQAAAALPPASPARQRATGAVIAALTADPTLGERQQRWVDVLTELLRRLAPLARQAASHAEYQRLARAGESTAHLGRTNPMALEDLDHVSGRCTVIAAQITAEAWPDWDTPMRARELSASRLARHAHELPQIADWLRRVVAPALDLSHPDPAAVRLAALAELIAPRPAQDRRCAAPGCEQLLETATTGRPRLYCGPACRQRARRVRLELAATT
jgi:hypothetical protein